MKESIAAVNSKYQMSVLLEISITTLKKQKDINKKDQGVKRKADISTVPQ